MYESLGNGDRSKLSNYFNCEFEPLVEGDDDVVVIEAFPPPECHLFFGAVGHILIGMLGKIRTQTLDEKLFDRIEAWLSRHGIERKNYQDHGLLGNDANKLVEKADELIRMLPPVFQNFGIALKKLGHVQDACFGRILLGNAPTLIKDFEDVFRKLPITMSNKIHIICHDVPRFLSMTRTPLGLFNEQQFEAVHRDFGLKWLDYKTKVTSPSFEKHLLDCVVAYNSGHIGASQ